MPKPHLSQLHPRHRLHRDCRITVEDILAVCIMNTSWKSVSLDPGRGFFPEGQSVARRFNTPCLLRKRLREIKRGTRGSLWRLDTSGLKLESTRGSEKSRPERTRLCTVVVVKENADALSGEPIQVSLHALVIQAGFKNRPPKKNFAAFITRHDSIPRTCETSIAAHQPQVLPDILRMPEPPDLSGP